MRRIINGRLVSEDRIEEGELWIEESMNRIVGIRTQKESNGCCEGETTTTDAEGHYVAPAFFDIHTHGAVGFDFLTATEEEVQKIAAFHRERGEAHFLATVVTASAEDMAAAVARLSKMKVEGLRGIHLEGPFLNPLHKGAQNEAHLLLPTRDVFRKIVGDFEKHIKMLTLAPELPGAEEVIREARSIGIRVAAGHTALSYSEGKAAEEKGISVATHLFNGMKTMFHRDLGFAGYALLNPTLTTEIIADGVHLSEETLELVFRLRPISKIVTVSDSMMATGLSEGRYELGGLPVHVKNGRATLEGGNMAGSVTPISDALPLLFRTQKLSVPEAVRTVTANPADALGMNDIGRIRLGGSADLVLLDEELRFIRNL